MKVCIIGDAGGHMTELLSVTEAFEEKYKKFYITGTDVYTSHIKPAYIIKIFSNRIIKLISFTWQLFFILIKERPDVMISTGSDIAVIGFYLGKIVINSKLIFIECSAQVTSPSKTGKLVYPITSLFLVQWESLLSQYGQKAKYVGGLI